MSTRRERQGIALGALGVLLFSMSLPATKAAAEGFDPILTGIGRAVVAALLAGTYLLVTRAPRPDRESLRRLLIASAGVVIGFPLLVAIALEEVDSAHGAVVVGLAPAATAVAATLRAGERPSLAFWLAAAAGVLAVLAFALTRGAGGVEAADLLLLAAVAAVGIGYAEGAVVARELGGTATISWAVVLALPLTLVLTVGRLALGGAVEDPDLGAWLGLAWVSVVSMFLGFIPWYAGLARGGVAKVGQLQLLQGPLTFIWAVLLLSETVDAATLAAGFAVVVAAGATQRTQVRAAPARSPA